MWPNEWTCPIFVNVIPFQKPYGQQNGTRWLPGHIQVMINVHRLVYSKFTRTCLLNWWTDFCTPLRMASNVILNSKVIPLLKPLLCRALHNFFYLGDNVISWSRENGCPAVLHSRGVWGVLPQEIFAILSVLEAHSGAFWGTELLEKRLIIIIIIAHWATGTLETISIS